MVWNSTVKKMLCKDLVCLSTKLKKRCLSTFVTFVHMRVKNDSVGIEACLKGRDLYPRGRDADPFEALILMLKYYRI